MSFGISNVGVINQRNAPAIWESSSVDFPTNYVLGRILIATSNDADDGIYIDTSTNRVRLTNGTVNANNGLTPSQNTGEVVIQLGGYMETNTDINSNSSLLRWLGANTGVNFKPDGSITDAITDAGFVIALPDGVPAVPTTTITLYDPSTGNGYRFAVEPV